MGLQKAAKVRSPNEPLREKKGEAEVCLFGASLENMAEQNGTLRESDPPLHRYKGLVSYRKHATWTH